MKRTDLIAAPWKEYELLDSGQNKKLERYGQYVLIRPETQALWAPARPAEWKRAGAEYRWTGAKGTWQTQNVPAEWPLAWENLRFTVRLTAFKHTGVFPEQVPNWAWVRERVEAQAAVHGAPANDGPKVLNLFGYTGLASIAAAQAGAHVTHVDASKQSNSWAKENAQLSNVPAERIRYILEDALRFVEREKRRGAKYEGIILDPPAFGRGAEGEVWRIEEHLPKLLSSLRALLSPAPNSFFLLNGYAAGYSPTSFLQAMSSVFGAELSGPRSQGEFGELAIKETRGSRLIPSGIYVRFAR